VLNALRREPHISHFTLDQAVELLRDLQPEKGFLTHISHQMGRHVEVDKLLPPNVHLAFDGLKIEL
jgi:phosphoribosyl 1,2-cyclic phosphate phosphodiesterase